MRNLFFLVIVMSFVSCATAPEKKPHFHCKTYIPVVCGVIGHNFNKKTGYYDRIIKPCYEKTECIKGE